MLQRTTPPNNDSWLDSPLPDSCFDLDGFPTLREFFENFDALTGGTSDAIIEERRKMTELLAELGLDSDG